MNVIEIKDFQKSFGPKVIHRGVNLSAQQGECVGLIGGSGAGKSVILRSIIGLEKPDEGDVIIDGENIAGYNEDELLHIRKKCAYVFQEGALFDSMTVAENLSYPLIEHTDMTQKEILSKVTSVLNSFGLQGTEQLMPASLSGGMQKRVGLARAIILEPKVVLYDEPTAGLDPFNTKKIQEKILELKDKGVTSLLVTHDMPTAFAVCDRMALLLNGTIVAEGTNQELRKDKQGLLQTFINGEEA